MCTPENIKQTLSCLMFAYVVSTLLRVYTSWYFLPSYSRWVFSYPNIHNFSYTCFSLSRAVLPVFVLLYRKRWKENSSKRFCTEISNLGNYFTITAEGRNTCLIISSAGIKISLHLEKIFFVKIKYFDLECVIERVLMKWRVVIDCMTYWLVRNVSRPARISTRRIILTWFHSDLWFDVGRDGEATTSITSN